MNRAARGTSLLECAAALVLTGMLSAELGRSLQASSLILRVAQTRADAIDVARNLLDSQIGSPCGSPYVCPPRFVCSIVRTGIAQGLDRVSASAAGGSSEQPVEFSLLAPAPACS